MNELIMAYRPGSREHMQHYAAFASAAYQRSSEQRQQIVPPGFVLDTEISNRNRAVFYNPDTFQVIMAERGTQPKGKTALADLSTDAALAFGWGDVTTRFRNSLKTAKAIQQQYPGWDFTVTGHSLGGSIAKYVHDQLDLQAVTFSAHTPTRDIIKEALMNTASASRDLHQYTVAYDPVGAGTFLTGGAYAVKQTSGSSHALTNFTAA